MEKAAAMLTLVVAVSLSSSSWASIVYYEDEATWESTITTRTLATFDEFAEGTVISTQYSGATFWGTSGSYPARTFQATADTQAEAVSEPNFLAIKDVGNGGWGYRWGVTFTTPVSGVALYYLGVGVANNSYLIIKDANGNVIDNSPYFQTEDPIETMPQVGFVGLVSDSQNIASIEMSEMGGDWVGWDNVQWGVPEPASLSLLVLGGSLMLRRRR